MTPRQQSELRRRFDEWCDVWWARIARQVPAMTQQDLFAVVKFVSPYVPIDLRPRERARLKDIWLAAHELVASAAGLAPDLAGQYGIESDLIESLVRIRDAIDPLEPLTPKRSGGDWDKRLNKARKELSALSVYDLLTRLNHEPTDEHDELYLFLTDAVFNIATRNDFGTTLAKVCHRVWRFRQVRPRRTRRW